MIILNCAILVDLAYIQVSKWYNQSLSNHDLNSLKSRYITPRQVVTPRKYIHTTF